ncbi:unnamed protein product [Amoebophrya sp. A120]|nr:unnamed protein product [Amoebophrya sp. A120]|eukprot:GSA120T00007511001.1
MPAQQAAEHDDGDDSPNENDVIFFAKETNTSSATEDGTQIQVKQPQPHQDSADHRENNEHQFTAQATSSDDQQEGLPGVVGSRAAASSGRGGPPAPPPAPPASRSTAGARMMNSSEGGSKTKDEKVLRANDLEKEPEAISPEDEDVNGLKEPEPPPEEGGTAPEQVGGGEADRTNTADLVLPVASGEELLQQGAAHSNSDDNPTLDELPALPDATSGAEIRANQVSVLAQEENAKALASSSPPAINATAGPSGTAVRLRTSTAVLRTGPNWYWTCTPEFAKWSSDPFTRGRGQESTATTNVLPTAELSASSATTNNLSLRLFVTIWNLHGKTPPADFSTWIPHSKENLHHLYVIGTCESCQTINRAILRPKRSKLAKYARDFETFLNSIEVEENGDAENHAELSRSPEGLGSADQQLPLYTPIVINSLGATHLMVFAHRSILKMIWDVKTTTCACGFGNLVGNKGGVLLGMSIGSSSFLFVCSHLPAHKSGMKQRTAAFKRIMNYSKVYLKPAKRMASNHGAEDEEEGQRYDGHRAGRGTPAVGKNTANSPASRARPAWQAADGEADHAGRSSTERAGTTASSQENNLLRDSTATNGPSSSMRVQLPGAILEEGAHRSHAGEDDESSSSPDVDLDADDDQINQSREIMPARIVLTDVDEDDHSTTLIQPAAPRGGQLLRLSPTLPVRHINPGTTSGLLCGSNEDDADHQFQDAASASSPCSLLSSRSRSSSRGAAAECLLYSSRSPTSDDDEINSSSSSSSDGVLFSEDDEFSSEEDVADVEKGDYLEHSGNYLNLSYQSREGTHNREESPSLFSRLFGGGGGDKNRPRVHPVAAQHGTTTSTPASSQQQQHPGSNSQADFVFFFGDLNFRLNMKREAADNCIVQSDHRKLLASDTLLPMLSMFQQPRAGAGPPPVVVDGHERQTNASNSAPSSQLLHRQSSEDNDSATDDIQPRVVLQQPNSSSGVEVGSPTTGMNSSPNTGTTAGYQSSFGGVSGAVTDLSTPTGAGSGGAAPSWSEFAEMPINFPPTYKINAFTRLDYDTSKKKRVPAWTDRILYKPNKNLKPLCYDAIFDNEQLYLSDHRPVYAQFEAELKNVNRWTPLGAAVDQGQSFGSSVSSSAATTGGSSMCVLM